jgi:hypothetical protein
MNKTINTMKSKIQELKKIIPKVWAKKLLIAAYYFLVLN